MEYEYVKESINESIRGLKAIFNVYVTAYGTLILAILIKNLDKYEEKGKPLIFLNFPIYPEYFSLIFGVLFILFVFIIFMKFRQFKRIFDRIEELKDIELQTIHNLIRYFPWIGSPLNESRLSLSIFRTTIVLGLFTLLFVGISHVCYEPKPCFRIGECVYKLIGIFDIIAFVLGLILVYKCHLDIVDIRKKLLLKNVERTRKGPKSTE